MLDNIYIYIYDAPPWGPSGHMAQQKERQKYWWAAACKWTRLQYLNFEAQICAHGSWDRNFYKSSMRNNPSIRLRKGHTPGGIVSVHALYPKDPTTLRRERRHLPCPNACARCGCVWLCVCVCKCVCPPVNEIVAHVLQTLANTNAATPLHIVFLI